jgi:hypothetical protein
LLGEGFRMGMAFTARDYAKEAGSGVEVLQYGLYYNLEEGIYSNDDTWKSGELAPRPAASAFAATTFTLEGFRPVPAWNAVLEGEYGPDGIRIYAFGRGEDVVLALWHPEGQRLIEGLPSFLSLRFGVQADPAGTDPSLVDWMGNPASVSWGPFSRFRVGPEPVYITGLRRPQLSRSGLPLRGGAVRIEPDEPFEPFEW